MWCGVVVDSGSAVTSNCGICTQLAGEWRSHAVHGAKPAALGAPALALAAPIATAPPERSPVVIREALVLVVLSLALS